MNFFFSSRRRHTRCSRHWSSDVCSSDLNGIALKNRPLFFEAMFAAASETLLTLSNDEKRLGAQIGFTAVLHTWTRDLRFHPHLHCTVTGGGLAPDAATGKATRRDYLFPLAVLPKLFRGKL